MGCPDIATQLVGFDIGGGLDLALGGGKEMFFGTGGERRRPEEDLTSEWLSAAPKRRYVETAAELAELVFDSATEELVVVRAESDTRQVTFRAPGVEIETHDCSA